MHAAGSASDDVFSKYAAYMKDAGDGEGNSDDTSAAPAAASPKKTGPIGLITPLTSEAQLMAIPHAPVLNHPPRYTKWLLSGVNSVLSQVHPQLALSWDARLFLCKFGDVTGTQLAAQSLHRMPQYRADAKASGNQSHGDADGGSAMALRALTDTLTSWFGAIELGSHARSEGLKACTKYREYLSSRKQNGGGAGEDEYSAFKTPNKYGGLVVHSSWFGAPASRRGDGDDGSGGDGPTCSMDELWGQSRLLDKIKSAMKFTDATNARAQTRLRALHAHALSSEGDIWQPYVCAANQHEWEASGVAVPVAAQPPSPATTASAAAPLLPSTSSAIKRKAAPGDQRDGGGGGGTAEPAYREVELYLSAVVEYLIAEILELAGNCARGDGASMIGTRHLLNAIRHDNELSALFDCAYSEPGVLDAPCEYAFPEWDEKWLAATATPASEPNPYGYGGGNGFLSRYNACPVRTTLQSLRREWYAAANGGDAAYSFGLWRANASESGGANAAPRVAIVPYPAPSPTAATASAVPSAGSTGSIAAPLDPKSVVYLPLISPALPRLAWESAAPWCSVLATKHVPVVFGGTPLRQQLQARVHRLFRALQLPLPPAASTTPVAAATSTAAVADATAPQKMENDPLMSRIMSFYYIESDDERRTRLVQEYRAKYDPKRKSKLRSKLWAIATAAAEITAATATTAATTAATATTAASSASAAPEPVKSKEELAAEDTKRTDALLAAHDWPALLARRLRYAEDRTNRSVGRDGQLDGCDELPQSVGVAYLYELCRILTTPESEQTVLGGTLLDAIGESLADHRNPLYRTCGWLMLPDKAGLTSAERRRDTRLDLHSRERDNLSNEEGWAMDMRTGVILAVRPSLEYRPYEQSPPWDYRVVSYSLLDLMDRRIARLDPTYVPRTMRKVWDELALPAGDALAPLVLSYADPHSFSSLDLGRWSAVDAAGSDRATLAMIQHIIDDGGQWSDACDCTWPFESFG